MGEVPDEWYIYATTHPELQSRVDLEFNLKRYLLGEVARKFVKEWEDKGKLKDGDTQGLTKAFGEILSAEQIFLPVRILAKDLYAAGYPVARYIIEWVPEQHRKDGELHFIPDQPVALHLTLST
jgi:hypothetical protein